MRTAKIILMVILVLLFTILVVQNTDVVTVQLFVWEVTMSQIILLVLTLLTGFVLGYFAARGFRLKRKIKRSGSGGNVSEQPITAETAPAPSA